jgi:hypothetical protein
MTTLFEVDRACAVCGQESRQLSLTSTSAFGAPDLDLRPPLWSATRSANR